MENNAARIEMLGNLMKSVDWWGDTSNDFSVPRASGGQVEEIIAALSDLAKVDLPAALKLWQDYAPKEWALPAFMKDVTPEINAIVEAAPKVAAVEEEKEDNSIRQAVVAPEEGQDAIRPVHVSPSEKNATNDQAKETPLPAPNGAPATLLGGRFVRDSAGIYRREGETREALADEGVKIRFIDKQMDAFQAGVELAKAKGWKAIEVTGSEAFRAEAWFHAKAAGLDVIGYEPKEQDLKRLDGKGMPVKEDQKGIAAALPNDVAASQKQAIDYVTKEGLAFWNTNVGQGRYTGKLIHETPHHLVQEIGRQDVVIHAKGALDSKFKDLVGSSKVVKVVYQDGRASVQASEKGRDLSR